MSHRTSRQFPRNCDSSQSLEIVAQAADVPHNQSNTTTDIFRSKPIRKAREACSRLPNQ